MRKLTGLLYGVLLVGCTHTREERLPPAIEPELFVARAAPPTIDHLSEAAACIERRNESAAVPHLQAHLVDRPHALMIRAYLAELLLRVGQPIDARREFEVFTRQAVGKSGDVGRHLVHAHTRLMELAAEYDDPFSEHLHRGIAILLTVKQWEDEPSVDDGEIEEATLVLAARELQLAERVRPTDPQPNVYLAEVYDRLGQPTAAAAAARRIHRPDGALTALEWAMIEKLAD